MAFSLPFDNHWLNTLISEPGYELTSKVNGVEYTAKIVLPNYKKEIEKYFTDIIDGSLESECTMSHIPCSLEHFGVTISFKSPTELVLYDDELNLPDGLCDIIARVGPVIIKNAYFTSSAREYGHRNRFPHLQFHIDRNEQQETRYSLYTRNPFDDEQKYPRTASTLFIANIAAYFQAIKQGSMQKNYDGKKITSQLLFDKTDMNDVIGNVVLEQSWDEPEGVGEIAMIDNATVLHASYYRDASHSGYKIGVRYLAGK